jgi:hypothetical protein
VSIGNFRSELKTANRSDEGPQCEEGIRRLRAWSWVGCGRRRETFTASISVTKLAKFSGSADDSSAVKRVRSAGKLRKKSSDFRIPTC